MRVQLRIYRTFEWVPAPYAPGEPVTYGGPPRPLVLRAKDTLQSCELGEWQDVPVVEADKPPHPQRDRFGRHAR
jgi:hypothetical protein